MPLLQVGWLVVHVLKSVTKSYTPPPKQKVCACPYYKLAGQSHNKLKCNTISGGFCAACTILLTFNYLNIYLFIHLFTFISIYLSIYKSIYLFIFQFGGFYTTCIIILTFKYLVIQYSLRVVEREHIKTTLNARPSTCPI